VSISGAQVRRRGDQRVLRLASRGRGGHDESGKQQGVVAGQIRDIHALAAAAGRRPHNPRQPRGAWRGLAALAGARVLVRSHGMIKAVEEL